MRDAASQERERARGEPLLGLLRRSTRSLHDTIERRLRLGEPHCAVAVDHYTCFLRASLVALGALEPIVIGILEPAPTTRVAALLGDLAVLGASVSMPPRVAPSRRLRALEDRAAAHGAAYVVEGSSLGGLALAARVEAALGREALRYLRLRGEDTGPAWRRFVQRLEEFGRSACPAERDRARTGARTTFGIYARAFAAEGLLASAPTGDRVVGG